MITFELGNFAQVDLCDLLKLEGLAASGAEAKALISQGLVQVDGVIELRKRCKIYSDQTVSIDKNKVRVVKSSQG